MNTKYVGSKALEKMFGKLTFAKTLVSFRLCEEMSQVQMAKKLKISKQSLNDLEKGRTLPSIERAVDIAQKLGAVEIVFVKIAIQDQIDRAKLGFEIELNKKKKAS